MARRSSWDTGTLCGKRSTACVKALQRYNAIAVPRITSATRCLRHDHTLEFRHGPKSIVGPETLLVFLLSESGFEAECEALKEMKSLGATTVAVTHRTNEIVRAASDLVVDFKLDVPEFARLVPYLFVGQLLGLHAGLKKGLDPDSPRNLSRVVVLDDEKSGTKPEHASI